MKLRLMAAVLAVVAFACGDDDAATTTAVVSSTIGDETTTTTAADTTTTEAVTTTTSLPLTDPRFPETNLSARFTGPDGEPVEVGFDPNSLLALFYQDDAGHLVVVITGFDPATTVIECGWALVYFGDESVYDAESFYVAGFTSYSNQPWATEGATALPRCEEDFLEEGALRPDIVPAVQCGDYIAFVLDELAITVPDSPVSTPLVEILAETADGSVDLEAIPWVAHPGAFPTVADLLTVDPGVLDCAPSS